VQIKGAGVPAAASSAPLLSAAATRACVYQAAGVERVARFLIVCKGVAEHERSVFRELVVELARSFRFRPSAGRESGDDVPCAQTGKGSRREERGQI
jgi:hypothetical protein